MPTELLMPRLSETRETGTVVEWLALAVSAGVCACLHPRDYLVPSFRGHGEFLAKGGSPRAAMAELFARDTGCARGMSGSMHLGDRALNIVPGVAIVGEGIAIATGLALSARMQGSEVQ